jgi:hypothetical protein
MCRHRLAATAVYPTQNDADQSVVSCFENKSSKIFYADDSSIKQSTDLLNASNAIRGANGILHLDTAD